MLDATDLRPGIVVLLNNQPHLVTSYFHRVLGRKKARVRIGFKNLVTGTTLEKAFLSGNGFEEADLTERKLTYIYSDRENSIFEDGKGEKFEMSNELILKQRAFLVKKQEYSLLFWVDEPISLKLPKAMVLTIVEAMPGVRGDSATNLFKMATLNNGMKVKVPLFIDVGEKVSVDTETVEYRERVKQ